MPSLAATRPPLPALVRNRRTCFDPAMKHLPWALQLLLTLAACTPRSAPPCPPCQCNCTGTTPTGTGTATPGPIATPTGSDDQATALLTSANRKFAHKDGPGCLADLDHLTALRPTYATSTVTTRASCEMLAGRCQQGKARLTRYWREEQNMHPERAASTTESMAAMYCRGGDSNERDRLLAAILDLSMGTSETHTVAQCEASYSTIRQLQPRVKPNGPDDHQVLNASSNLYALAPMCFARAGDCRRARATFTESFPPERLADLAPAVRITSMQSIFESLVPRCK